MSQDVVRRRRQCCSLLLLVPKCISTCCNCYSKAALTDASLSLSLSLWRSIRISSRIRGRLKLSLHFKYFVSKWVNSAVTFLVTFLSMQHFSIIFSFKDVRIILNKICFLQVRTYLGCARLRGNFKKVYLGCRHSSVDSSAPSILPPRVRLPSMPSMLFKKTLKGKLIFITSQEWSIS